MPRKAHPLSAERWTIEERRPRVVGVEIGIDVMDALVNAKRNGQCLVETTGSRCAGPALCSLVRISLRDDPPPPPWQGHAFSFHSVGCGMFSLSPPFRPLRSPDFRLWHGSAP